MPNPFLFWLLFGSALCLVEVFVPVAFVSFVMGLSALAVAVLIRFVPFFDLSFGLQVVVWLAISAAAIFWSRRFAQQSTGPTMRDPTEGETLTEIPPGETGRVRYKGNSWRACCDDREISIPANQRVYIVRRQGTTLIVMPEHLVDA